MSKYRRRFPCVALGDCRKMTYQIAQDLRSPSRRDDGSMAGLCDCRRDAEGGRKDQRDGMGFDRNRLTVTLGPLPLNSLQRDRLRCAQALILRVAVSLPLLARPVGPTDRGDGRSVYVELLVAVWQMGFSLSIPIPIPIATPTPIALRQRMDRVVQVVNKPLLSRPIDSGWRSSTAGSMTSRVARITWPPARTALSTAMC